VGFGCLIEKLVKMSKAIELAKKLKALADKGVGGEKQNAEQMLEKFLKKHNLTIEEIEGEKINKYFFQIDNKYQQLLNQILKITNRSLSLWAEIPKNKIRQLRLAGNYMTECTASQFVEIKAKFDFYSNLYEEELDVFYTAFLHANNLLVESTAQDKEKGISDEERERQERAYLMSGRIKKGQYLKQLEKQNI
jgi:hypothetical protein